MKNKQFFLSISEAAFHIVQVGLELPSHHLYPYQLAKGDSEFPLFLPPPPKCSNYRCAPPCLPGLYILNDGSTVLWDRTFPGETQPKGTQPRQGGRNRCYGYHQSPARFIGITFKSKNDSKIAVSPKPTPAWVTAHESLEIGSTLHTLQADRQVGECPFQAAVV